MPFKHFATLVIWDNALPEGWELNDEHTNWPTNPVLDGLPYRLESKRYNDAVYVLDIEAFKRTNQMTEEAIRLLEDDLVNAKVESKMLHEQVDLVAAAEDIVENLLDPSDTRLAEAEATLTKFQADWDAIKREMEGAVQKLSALNDSYYMGKTDGFNAILRQMQALHATANRVPAEPKYSEGQEVKHPRMPILSPRAFIGGIIPNEDESEFCYWLRYADGTEEMEVIWDEEDLSPVTKEQV